MVSTATPLWRNGPQEKPVLCNACGSRYRNWGSLEDYLPKHSLPEHQNNLSNANGGSSNLNVKVKLRSNVPYIGNGASDKLNPDNTISAQGTINTSLWNCKIPVKKRSSLVCNPVAPMERFRRKLLSLWRAERQQIESSQEEVLLFDIVNNFVPSNEIGLGGMLLKPDGTSA